MVAWPGRARVGREVENHGVDFLLFWGEGEIRGTGEVQAQRRRTLLLGPPKVAGWLDH